MVEKNTLYLLEQMIIDVIIANVNCYNYTIWCNSVGIFISYFCYSEAQDDWVWIKLMIYVCLGRLGVCESFLARKLICIFTCTELILLRRISCLLMVDAAVITVFDWPLCSFLYSASNKLIFLNYCFSPRTSAEVGVHLYYVNKCLECYLLLLLYSCVPLAL